MTNQSECVQGKEHEKKHHKTKRYFTERQRFAMVPCFELMSLVLSFLRCHILHLIELIQV